MVPWIESRAGCCVGSVVAAIGSEHALKLRIFCRDRAEIGSEIGSEVAAEPGPMKRGGEGVVGEVDCAADDFATHGHAQVDGS
jgi:hypothetical protein